MTFAKFEGNRFRIDGEIAENHAILVNLTASIDVVDLHSTATEQIEKKLGLLPGSDVTDCRPSLVRRNFPCSPFLLSNF